MKDELVIHSKPKSNVAEAIRTIRTNLQFTDLDGSTKVLLITSSIPGEGKSFVSSNLAISFAQAGEKVLLIDGDLRLGRIHRLFGMSNDIGLSNLLATQDKVKYKDYIKESDIDFLYILPRGIVPPNPSELISNNFPNLIKELRKKFNHIIIDGVPVNGLPESLIMSNSVDKVILVCAENYTKIDELQNAKKSLEKVGANIAGIVVNKEQAKKGEKYNRYYSNR